MRTSDREERRRWLRTWRAGRSDWRLQALSIFSLAVAFVCLASALLVVTNLAAVRDLLVIGACVIGLFVLGLVLDIYEKTELQLLRRGTFDETLGIGLLLLIGLAIFSIRRTTQAARDRSARKDTELQFRTVIEQAPATPYTSDATKPAGEAPILYMSPQVEKLLGYPASEWLADPALWLRCIHEDDRERVREVLAAAIRAKTDYEVEHRIRRRDGSVRIIAVVGHPVLDESGRVTHVIGTSMDITDRRAAEAELRRKEAFLIEVQRLSRTRSWISPVPRDPEPISGENFEVVGLDHANPAPPVGPALGQHGVNIMEFCKAYNAATESQRGDVVPVEISVYEDRSFDFKLKTPPAAKLLLKAAGVEKGSGEPHKTKVAKVTWDQVRDIAKTKETDLNAHDIDQAAKIIAGTARSMGITVVD